MTLTRLFSLSVFSLALGCAPSTGPNSADDVSVVELEALASYLEGLRPENEVARLRVEALRSLARWAKDGMPEDERAVCEPLKVVLLFSDELERRGMAPKIEVLEVLERAEALCGVK